MGAGELALLWAISPFVMVLGIVGFVQGRKMLRDYLEWRLQMAERQFRRGDQSVMRAIEELRAEMAAMRQHETEAILSFDSTLQTLDARLKHLERKALAEGTGERAAFATQAPSAIEEPARLTAKGA